MKSQMKENYEGKTNNDKKSYYHCSPYRLKIGTVLNPNQKDGYSKKGHRSWVCVCDKPIPHGTISNTINRVIIVGICIK